jgi:STE24 endopeptidase
MFVRRSFALCALLLGLAAGPALAQGGPSAAPTSRVDVQALPPIAEPQTAPETLDVDKAVNGYLNTVSGQARANSNAYFEGGYVLLFVDALYALVVCAILLWGRLSSWMRTAAMKTMFVIAGAFAMMLKSAPEGMRNRMVRFFMAPGWQTAAYAVQYIVLTTVLTFPLAVYEGFFREHAYNLSNQSFGEWFGEFGIAFVLEVVFVAIGLTILYAAIRRAKRTWWMWGAGLFVAFSIVGMIFAPVYIAPLFNTYTPLPDSLLKNEILSQAKANGIPVDNVYLVDASRQSKRISANVSGFMGTTRVSLNDNLLNQTTPQETLAVLGHEMGHYVLDHTVRLLMFAGLFAVIGFAFADWAFGWAMARWGTAWDVRGIDDPAGLPVLFAIFVIFNLVTTPFQNTVSRTTEAQADIFGLDAVRQPDGFASVSMKLSNYRKLDPGPWEEAIFYDHPSGRSRVTMAMTWKAQHMNDPDIKAGPKSPQ